MALRRIWHALALSVPIVHSAYLGAVTNLGLPGQPKRSMLALYVPTGAARVVKLYRAYYWNNHEASGVNALLLGVRINRLTACSGGMPVFVRPTSPARQDVAEVAPLQVVTGAATTVGGLYRRILSHEPNVIASTPGAYYWWVALPTTKIWAAGDRDARVQPITLREGQGIETAIEPQTPGLFSTTGWINVTDHEYDFTSEAS